MQRQPALWFSALATALFAASLAYAQELIKNGSFLSMQNWDFKVSGQYLKDSKKPSLTPGAEGLKISGLGRDHHHEAWNILLAQDVSLEKGRKYRFSAEVRAPSGGGDITVLGHAPFGGPSWKLLNDRPLLFFRKIALTPEWQTIEVRFECKFSRNDIAEMKKELRLAIQNHPEWDKARQKIETEKINWDAKDSRLGFWLASAYGDVQIRNVSLQPLP